VLNILFLIGHVVTIMVGGGNCIGCEILTVVRRKSVGFWVIMPPGLVKARTRRHVSGARLKRKGSKETGRQATWLAACICWFLVSLVLWWWSEIVIGFAIFMRDYTFTLKMKSIYPSEMWGLFWTKRHYNSEGMLFQMEIVHNDRRIYSHALIINNFVLWFSVFLTGWLTRMRWLLCNKFLSQFLHLYYISLPTKKRSIWNVNIIFFFPL
jgi:hypothetical protein